MRNIDIADLATELVNSLTAELQDDASFNANVLEVKVKNAIRELILRRNYDASSYTDEQIASDLFNYFSTLYNVALYDFNQIGAEGEKTHSENGVSRQYVSRDTLFMNVFPFIKMM